MPAADAQRQHPLAALGLAPLGLSRVEAAAYIRVSPTTFDAMVRDGRMPRPKLIRQDAGSGTRGRPVWSRPAIDAAFAALPERGGEGVDTPEAGTGTGVGSSADATDRWETRV